LKFSNIAQKQKEKTNMRSLQIKIFFLTHKFGYFFFQQKNCYQFLENDTKFQFQNHGTILPLIEHKEKFLQKKQPQHLIQHFLVFWNRGVFVDGTYLT
jgi:hypothetical protein